MPLNEKQVRDVLIDALCWAKTFEMHFEVLGQMLNRLAYCEPAETRRILAVITRYRTEVIRADVDAMTETLERAIDIHDAPAAKPAT